MKKHYALSGALFLSCGTPFFGWNVTYASPEPQAASSATQIVTGVVTDSKGEPVIGASVIEPETTRGTITDVDVLFASEKIPKSVFLM